MTKKDYILIARAIDEVRNSGISSGVQLQKWVEIFASSIAGALGRENTRFDRVRFMMACGVVEKEVRADICRVCGFPQIGVHYHENMVYFSVESEEGESENGYGT